MNVLSTCSAVWVKVLVYTVRTCTLHTHTHSVKRVVPRGLLCANWKAAQPFTAHSHSTLRPQVVCLCWTHNVTAVPSVCTLGWSVALSLDRTLMSFLQNIRTLESWQVLEKLGSLFDVSCLFLFLGNQSCSGTTLATCTGPGPAVLSSL